MGDDEEKSGMPKNMIQMVVAAGAFLVILGLVVLWLAIFQPDVGTVNTFFPEGACDGLSACTNVAGGFGAYQHDPFSLLRWFFIIWTGLNLLSLAGPGLIGSSNPGDIVAIIISAIVGLSNVGLTFWALIAWVPAFNKTGSGFRGNPFNDRRFCCVAEFYMDPANRCPNGQPNYPAGSEVACVSPFTTLTKDQLGVSGEMVYLVIATIVLVIANIVIIIAAALSITKVTNPLDILKSFGLGKKMKNPSKKAKAKVSDSDSEDSDYGEISKRNNQRVVSYAGQ